MFIKWLKKTSAPTKFTKSSPNWQNCIVRAPLLKSSYTFNRLTLQRNKLCLNNDNHLGSYSQKRRKRRWRHMFCYMGTVRGCVQIANSESKSELDFKLLSRYRKDCLISTHQRALTICLKLLLVLALYIF